MDDFFNVPVYKSENGENFYKVLSVQLGKPVTMEMIALLSLVRLLVFLPDSISKAVMSPIAAMPLMINHQDELVKKIVQLRLLENM